VVSVSSGYRSNASVKVGNVSGSNSRKQKRTVITGGITNIANRPGQKSHISIGNSWN